MKTFTEESLKTIAELNMRGAVSNERIGAMMRYLYTRGIRYWDGPGGISFTVHGYVLHDTSLTKIVRQFEHVLWLEGQST